MTSSSFVAQDLVDLLAARQDLVEQDVADDGPERRRRNALEGAREVRDVDGGLEGIVDPPIDEEVDADRGVVPGDGGLAGDLDELLGDVDLDRSVDDRDEEPQARLADQAVVGLAESEDDHPLVLLDHPHREVQDHQHDDEDERRGREDDRDLH